MPNEFTLHSYAYTVQRKCFQYDFTHFLKKLYILIQNITYAFV